MNEHDIFGIIAFSLACIGTAIYVFFKKRAEKKALELRRASYPTTWIHVGLPPPAGVEKALEVIKSQMPTWNGRWGGTIEWVKDPFLVGTVLAAGTVDEFEEPRLRLMYNVDVTKTALAHELHHVWQTKYEKSKIWDGDPLYAWVYETNQKIRMALSSIG
jgi:hypothetical protein